MKQKPTFTLITAITVLFSLCMLLLPLGASAQSDIINISDANFRACLVADFDTNKDGKISLSEAVAVKTISCHGKKISSMQGVEYFTELEKLWCYNNDLTSLDLSKNKALKGLACGNNNLTSLDVSNNKALTKLSCYSNDLTSLDVSNNKALTELLCFDNKITSLDVSNNEALTELRCATNNLQSLYLRNNRVLKKFDCQSNEKLANIYVWEGWNMAEGISSNDDGYKKDAHTKFIPY